MHSEQPTQLNLPDLFALCPFTWSSPSPYYSSKRRDSTEWILGYLGSLFPDDNELGMKQLRERMYASSAELLGSYVNPYADAEGLRISNDFHMILFVLDEITDVQDAESAAKTREVFVKALTGGCGDDESPVTSFTKDYMNRLSNISEAVRERFISHCISYIDATATEARLRADNEVLSIEEYTKLRRENGGVRTCFDLIEAVLGITLPAEVFDDPNFMRIYFAAVDMICWSNDIYSYPIEYAQGLETCNVITVLMKEKNLSVQGAMDHVAELFKDFADTMISCKQNIRSFGEDEDRSVQAYIYGMEQWVCGNLTWSFDCARYFGEKNEEVKKTGVVELVKRQDAM
ncbi:terpenoid synthase [Fomitiporia mediterranea MF3/22]|uniref:terpenoid synthase n=1 Tax=Fomitiporia mediterranea (strain MF3/22) TaxID=694068 RepID=UPI0004408B4F|nr:terpenoid synthase [Fomitiporia mediterranea MF3/22]EJD00897.1 terpenoid synthase [Fomitiporia mediterranea MF3/22]